jgi:hypothetical protein
MPHHRWSNFRELDSRRSDGIEVRLLWSESGGRVVVVVDDSRTDRRFTVDVRDGEPPLDVFHHPYAYAMWHGTGTGEDAARLTSRAA